MIRKVESDGAEERGRREGEVEQVKLVESD
jgi:hypothetical protein